MKILVTGGSGLLGSYLKYYIDGVFVSSADYDLTKEYAVEKMYADHNPDVVIHLAARVGGIMDNIVKPFEYLEDNILMNTYMIKYARKHNVRKFIGVLSSCIFPDVSDHYPMVEEDMHKDLPAATNFGYGYAKRLMGVHIEVARKEGLNYSYITPSNLYGEFERGDLMKKHFVGALLEKIYQANKNKEGAITIYGDGTPLRQFTFAKDVAQVLYLIIKEDIKESVNISTEANLSIKEMTELALLATNSQHLEIKYDLSKPNGQYRKDIDITRFKNIFPNYKFTPYIEGIKQTYNTLYGH